MPMLTASLAPSIWELNDVKKGVLAMLFGGNHVRIKNADTKDGQGLHGSSQVWKVLFVFCVLLACLENQISGGFGNLDLSSFARAFDATRCVHGIPKELKSRLISMNSALWIVLYE